MRRSMRTARCSWSLAVLAAAKIAAKTGYWTIEIVERSPWFRALRQNRCPRSMHLAMIRIMVRRPFEGVDLTEIT
jgi:hypothetical protein